MVERNRCLEVAHAHSTLFKAWRQLVEVTLITLGQDLIPLEHKVLILFEVLQELLLKVKAHTHRAHYHTTHHTSHTGTHNTWAHITHHTGTYHTSHRHISHITQAHITHHTGTYHTSHRHISHITQADTTHTHTHHT